MIQIGRQHDVIEKALAHGIDDKWLFGVKFVFFPSFIKGNTDRTFQVARKCFSRRALQLNNKWDTGGSLLNLVRFVTRKQKNGTRSRGHSGFNIYHRSGYTLDHSYSQFGRWSFPVSTSSEWVDPVLDAILHVRLLGRRAPAQKAGEVQVSKMF